MAPLRSFSFERRCRDLFLRVKPPHRRRRKWVRARWKQKIDGTTERRFPQQDPAADDEFFLARTADWICATWLLVSRRTWPEASTWPSNTNSDVIKVQKEVKIEKITNQLEDFGGALAHHHQFGAGRLGSHDRRQQVAVRLGRRRRRRIRGRRRRRRRRFRRGRRGAVDAAAAAVDLRRPFDSLTSKRKHVNKFR